MENARQILGDILLPLSCSARVRLCRPDAAVQFRARHGIAIRSPATFRRPLLSLLKIANWSIRALSSSDTVRFSHKLITENVIFGTCRSAAREVKSITSIVGNKATSLIALQVPFEAFRKDGWYEKVTLNIMWPQLSCREEFT